ACSPGASQEPDIVTFIMIQALIDFVRQSPSMTKATGDVSDLYYIFTMPRGNYRFALYLWHNPTPPHEISDHFPEYSHMRIISNIAFMMHIALGTVIFSTVFFNLVMKS
ncbi:hypothetical protein M8994_06715, partial [Brucella sp. 21LCYQ03]|nr:hypothetical protein [Brucella sp. 21LCYQ03]